MGWAGFCLTGCEFGLRYHTAGGELLAIGTGPRIARTTLSAAGHCRNSGPRRERTPAEHLDGLKISAAPARIGAPEAVGRLLYHDMEKEGRVAGWKDISVKHHAGIPPCDNRVGGFRQEESVHGGGRRGVEWRKLRLQGDALRCVLAKRRR